MKGIKLFTLMLYILLSQIKAYTVEFFPDRFTTGETSINEVGYPTMSTGYYFAGGLCGGGFGSCNASGSPYACPFSQYGYSNNCQQVACHKNSRLIAIYDPCGMKTWSLDNTGSDGPVTPYSNYESVPPIDAEVTPCVNGDFWHMTEQKFIIGTPGTIPAFGPGLFSGQTNIRNYIYGLCEPLPGYYSPLTEGQSYTMTWDDQGFIVEAVTVQPCPAGSKCEHGVKKLCTSGYYCTGATETICPAGYSCNNGFKTICGPGTYQDKEGQTECIPCEAGTVNSEYGASMCMPCSIDEYQAGPDFETCKQCPKNSLQPDIQQTSCKTCPDGYYCIGGEPNLCPTGHFCIKGGLSICGNGFYQPKYGQDYCLTCPVNAICSSTAIIGCKDGYYPSADDASQCLICPINHACHNDKVTPCYPTGYQPHEGQSRCIQCDGESFSLPDESTGCFNCRFGMTSINGQCVPCPIGLTSAGGAGKCFPCPPGYCMRPGSELEISYAGSDKGTYITYDNMKATLNPIPPGFFKAPGSKLIFGCPPFTACAGGSSPPISCGYQLDPINIKNESFVISDYHASPPITQTNFLGVSRVIKAGASKCYGYAGYEAAGAYIFECGDMTYSNSTTKYKCVKCKKHYVPNKNKDGCILSPESLCIINYDANISTHKTMNT